MKHSIKFFLAISMAFSFSYANGQLLDGLFKKDNTQADSPVSKEKKGEVIANDNTPETTSKKFTYKCFTLNTSIEIEEVSECINSKGEKIITDMQYYEQGEDIRVREKQNTIMVLSFLDDTKRLIKISVDDMEDINIVKYLQQQVLDQMGTPTQGYEIMKNYDGNKNAAWADYSTYEFVYRYIYGSTAYDFRVTQFGAKSKNNKIIHPYSFTATVSKKKELSDNPEETLETGDFYPPTGVLQVEDYTIETRILRKW